MIAETNASARPAVVVRVLLVAEVVSYVAAVSAYLLLALPAGEAAGWPAVLAAAGALAFPIAMNLLHGDRPADSGLRVDNLGASARQVLPITAALLAGVLAVGAAAGGFHWLGWRHFGDHAGLYLAWGPVQQYLLQAFGLRRLRQAGLPAPAAVVLAAGLFAWLHAPNWPLVGLTAGAGAIWCVLFLRRPNLITLGLAHAVLAVAVYYAWPQAWLSGLAIGRLCP